MRPSRKEMTAWAIVVLCFLSGWAGFAAGVSITMGHFKDEAVRVGHAHYRDGEFWWKAPKE